MNIEIIEATSPEQIEQFRALLLEYFQERPNGFSERMAQDLRDLPGRYAAPRGGMFLALCDGRPVATAAWTQHTPALVEMKRVYVQPEHRRKGIARALSQHVIEIARARGFAQVAISTWADATDAIALYRKLGFTEIPPFKASTVPDVIYLGLNLSPAQPSGMQVVKVSGSELDDPAFLAQFAAAVAQMKRAGAQPIVVHGGGKELTQLLTLMNAPTQFVDGLRVTDAKTRDAALMVLSGLANKRLVAALIAQGVDAIGLSGLDAGLIRAERLNDALGFVGRPVGVRATLLTAWIEQGLTPVIAPMSLGCDGEIYNVNADHVAGAIAAAVDADLLTFVTNVPGVFDRDKLLIPHLSAAQVEAMIADGTIFGGMIPKVRTALEALDAGVRRVRITDLAGLASGGGTVFASPA
ncbi:MAG: acetylglutamate kinase [Anaerolineae bacterium]|nr:acetylglutamate kinase [Candidatus Roseilinea sp.]MDW8451106.1 acetylglutamate kinase [Anaerolineae bacterium]